MKIKSINPATKEVMEEFRIVTHKEFSSRLKKARWAFTNWSYADVSEGSDPGLPFGRVKEEWHWQRAFGIRTFRILEHKVNISLLIRASHEQVLRHLW
ncbi:MAG: hypothetical protein ACUVWK_02345 [Nitrososphaerales archaeon]